MCNCTHCMLTTFTATLTTSAKSLAAVTLTATPVAFSAVAFPTTSITFPTVAIATPSVAVSTVAFSTTSVAFSAVAFTTTFATAFDPAVQRRIHRLLLAATALLRRPHMLQAECVLCAVPHILPSRLGVGMPHLDAALATLATAVAVTVATTAVALSAVAFPTTSVAFSAVAFATTAVALSAVTFAATSIAFSTVTFATTSIAFATAAFDTTSIYSRIKWHPMRRYAQRLCVDKFFPRRVGLRHRIAAVRHVCASRLSSGGRL